MFTRKATGLDIEKRREVDWTAADFIIKSKSLAGKNCAIGCGLI